MIIHPTMWVFGYGSLIWKVDFPYEKKLVGYIKGYVRRFYQKSTDHRGIPAKPGRVVTLLESGNSKDRVWGVAYKIAAENIDDVVNHLDLREKGGYMRKTVLFHPGDASPRTEISSVKLTRDLSPNENLENTSPKEETPFYLTIYIGGEDNPNFAGVENTETIAAHIIEARGPSGSNTEYLYKLAASMRLLAPDVRDEHLFGLETAVKVLEGEREKEIMSINEGCA